MGNRYMLSYEKTGKPMKLIYADSLVKLQDKAQKLRKQGFAIPFDQWFFEDKENGQLFKHLLLNKNSRLYDFFNENSIKELWDGYNKNAGKFNYFGTLWLLFIFSLWLEENSNINFEN